MWFAIGANCYPSYPHQCLSMSCKDMLKHDARVNKTENLMIGGQKEINCISNHTHQHSISNIKTKQTSPHICYPIISIEAYILKTYTNIEVINHDMYSGIGHQVKKWLAGGPNGASYFCVKNNFVEIFH